MIFLFSVHIDYQCHRLEDQHGCKTDEEGEDENLGHVGLVVVAEKDHGEKNSHMKEQRHNGGAQEKLDKLAGRLLHAFNHDKVLKPCNNGEIESHERHEEMELRTHEEQHREGHGHKEQGDNGEGDVVTFHHSANFMVSLVVNFSQ